jgi:predicted phage terminase large subunit-like protein
MNDATAIGFEQNSFEAIVKDRQIRREVARHSHLMFFYIHFSHYVTYPIAEFQKDIFRITEDVSNKLAIICAFRGSGKSTLISFSYALWSILGIQQKKFVLIISQTRAQSKQHMMNLKRELEANVLLRSDLGPFQEEDGEWGASSLVFTALNARITAASTETSIRGLRHNQHRPDLIILDDVEDLASVKTHESRQKTYNWLSGEVIPSGDRNTRVIVIGNMLHRESLVMHLKKDIDEGMREGVFKAYPLVEPNGTILWTGKYPTSADIEEERKKSGNEYAFQREYMLNVLSDEDQVIDPTWIQYYDKLPNSPGTYRGLFMGVDLAISQKETADYTAIVSGVLYGHGKEFCLYILPNIVNRRMKFPEQIEQIKSLYFANRLAYSRVALLVESNGFQEIVVDQLKNQGVHADGIKTLIDKRSRIVTISDLIKCGKIKFPLTGAEMLIRQLVDFGIEAHDDAADAFTFIAQRMIDLDGSGPFIATLSSSTRHDPNNSFDRGWHTVSRANPSDYFTNNIYRKRF